ncbi:hypothetical protein [Xenorhabdus bharatensis]|uniref:hypothetical protein n=1 Tax=Xenorhabdus bharatensis TaxID=3136256 RepID=UPI0030F40D0A
MGGSWAISLCRYAGETINGACVGTGTTGPRGEMAVGAVVWRHENTDTDSE